MILSTFVSILYINIYYDLSLKFKTLRGNSVTGKLALY